MMAYIKKKDRLLNELKKYVKNNGFEMILDGLEGKQNYLVWNSWPICVQDICVDNICLRESDNILIGCNIDSSIGTYRLIDDLHQRYIESILHDVIEGYTKKRK